MIAIYVLLILVSLEIVNTLLYLVTITIYVLLTRTILNGSASIPLLLVMMEMDVRWQYVFPMGKSLTLLTVTITIFVKMTFVAQLLDVTVLLLTVMITACTKNTGDDVSGCEYTPIVYNDYSSCTNTRLNHVMIK